MGSTEEVVSGYMPYDMLVHVLPTSITVEALACDSFYKSMGGHVW